MSEQRDGSSLEPNGGAAVYDYVIVGAGSAGCVLAARLGEDPDVRVLVIEAGPPNTEPVIHTPLAFRQLWDSRFDWGLWSEPEPGLGDRRDYLPRGRVLGGTSSLNTIDNADSAFDFIMFFSDNNWRGLGQHMGVRVQAGPDANSVSATLILKQWGNAEEQSTLTVIDDPTTNGTMYLGSGPTIGHGTGRTLRILSFNNRRVEKAVLG